VIKMLMRSPENYNVKLEQIRLEEESIQQHLHENAHSLSSSEVDRLNRDLIGLRLERGEIEQIITGAFY
jgi:hypothetical protein